ncbi:metacaspase-6-like [Silene latifolia]|uniref:metacaspase-6-like n=1 Tax=Silene latifolia TaxID=37657 RepID=UPI003D76A5A7
MLKETTGNDDIVVGKIRSTLFDIFGDDASPKVKEFMNITSNVVDIQAGEQGSSSRGILAVEGPGTDDTKPTTKTEGESTEEINTGTTKRVLPSNGILLSGCQTDETSADANPTGNPSEAYGAFTNAILSILKDSKKDINNYQIVLKARKLLKRQGFTQRPGLYCSDDYAKAPFLY